MIVPSIPKADNVPKELTRPQVHTFPNEQLVPLFRRQLTKPHRNVSVKDLCSDCFCTDVCMIMFGGDWQLLYVAHFVQNLCESKPQVILLEFDTFEVTRMCFAYLMCDSVALVMYRVSALVT